MDVNGFRFVVTGGGGFIGTHLVEGLLALHPQSITVIDDFSYGSRSNLELIADRINIVSLRIGPGIEKALSEILNGVDFVFHLAAEKHNQSIHDPLKVLDVNVTGMFELLNAACRAKVKKIIFSSSLYAYGRMTNPPLVENEMPEPDTVYGISKLTGENLCRHFAKKHGLRSACLRYFFTYGPKQFANQGYKSVIVKNFERLLVGHPPVIHGDGKQVLDYIYVHDVVERTITAASLPFEDQPINICSGQGISILDLTAIMQRVAGTNFEPIFGPADATHGTSRVGNPDKMHETFGTKPLCEIEEGLRLTWEWMKEKKS